MKIIDSVKDWIKGRRNKEITKNDVIEWLWALVKAPVFTAGLLVLVCGIDLLNDLLNDSFKIDSAVDAFFVSTAPFLAAYYIRRTRRMVAAVKKM